MAATRIKIGTRGSPLALWQAQKVAQALEAVWPGLAAHIVPIKTSGDKILDRSLATVGGKGLFVKEIEDALLSGTIDIAVHSMKDMPAELPRGLAIAAVLEREEYRDALVSGGVSFDVLRGGAVVGTTSLRRRAEAGRRRADLRFELCRGNVETRLKKLSEGVYDAIVLSAAGLLRLGLEDRISDYLDWIPAPGQGVIGIECKDDDARVLDLLRPLDHAPTHLSMDAERAFMRVLEGGCQVALGCLASYLSEGRLQVKGFWVHPRSGDYLSDSVSGAAQEARALGTRLAAALRDR